MPLYTTRKTRSRSLQRGCWRPSKRRLSRHGRGISCRQLAGCSCWSTRIRNGFVSIFENWYILSSCEVCGCGCVVVSCVFATLCSECSCWEAHCAAACTDCCLPVVYGSQRSKFLSAISIVNVLLISVGRVTLFTSAMSPSVCRHAVLGQLCCPVAQLTSRAVSVKGQSVAVSRDRYIRGHSMSLVVMKSVKELFKIWVLPHREHAEFPLQTQIG